MIYNHDTNIVTLTFFQLIEKHVWVLLKDCSNAHWDYLKYKHKCYRVQIEHPLYIPWCHSDGTTVYCLSVNDKKQSSVQSCYISLCTQQSQSAGKFSSHLGCTGLISVIVL